jgi:hypothetical protein
MYTLFDSLLRDGRISGVYTEHVDVALVSVVGDCDVWDTDKLREAINHVEDSSAQVCIVSLSEATYLCARVFGIVSVAGKRIQARGGLLEIVCPDGHIACKRLALLQLPYRNWETVDDAIANSLNGSTEPSVNDRAA